ncbi:MULTISPECIES: type III secretion system export apparatus subunit SctV [unclassified Luteimonas]|uniref:type III secretion system export apparatus subunit SctV n=1 Tax=unclassified Luteimonas TaxID=2629088 RepID=UPI0018F08EF4|nr:MULTISPECIES: type III secretion system export apparatus subunit SctV [unclassified Luteimonas]MBJ6979139.1 type III secretion system export apparatus subunit SctV [Luteimonas sp. MC1895]MBJ6985155.1 type III secretion system export apparatus subunit SctV [Luteimonas sp. MC1750]QQO05811.1 type III secretion system export apparatus subunit SctV [Luteimonas sp. MC1750]
MRALIENLFAAPANRKRAGLGYSDIVLAIAAVLIISVMILPLPLVVIDALVAVNISIGFGLLLLAIYIPSPVAFSSFPSVLLLTTLFRLALSIAITRSILLDAEGGHIVETFGNLVAGGNLVVGLVVFMIITVVQFIVIAKGAERVAEVSARFTLDAMPGKQLSIDSDLRSGLIDKDEAKRKRRHLETESQLHGALDGAMKFVKGDAIAGIVIIIINLLGGLAIGVLQRDMALADATRTYSILTIGDGLVSQIPAILATIAAGLVVTRTTSEVDDKHLGAAIGRQVSGQPRVMLITGLLALLMTLVPGFPKLVFLALGLTLLGMSAWRYRHGFQMLRRAFRVPEGELAESEIAEQVDDLAPPAPLQLDLSPSLAPMQDALLARVSAVAQGMRDEFGVPVPAPKLRLVEGLGEGGYRLSAFGARLASGQLRTDAAFRRAPVVAGDNRQAGFFPALSGEWVASGSPDALAPEDLLDVHARAALQRRLGGFIGIQETANLFARMQRDYPDLVKEMLRVVAPQRVADVLRRLAEEGVPIRNLRDVFEAITDVGGREKDVVLLTEYVRVALKREIAERHADAERTLHVLLIHPELEDKLRQSVRVAGGASQLAISPELAARLGGEVRAHLARQAAGVRPVLLCSLDVRRHLRKLMEVDFFELPVLSYQELAPDLRIVQAGQVNA